MKITPEQTDELRAYLTKIYDVCEQCDAAGTTVEVCGHELNVRQLFEVEITAYLFYLTASDKVVSQEEVDFINSLMGRTYSLEDCTNFIDRAGLMNEDFGKTMPASFKILDDFEKSQGKDISDVLISFYDVIGHVMTTVDDELAAREHEAHKSYVYLLRSYEALGDGAGD